MITLFNSLLYIALTIVLYYLGRKLNHTLSHPLTTPIFIASLSIIVLIVIGIVPFEQYQKGTQLINYFLGPATVALAYPLYKYRKLIVKNIVPIIIGVIVGSIFSSVIAYSMALALHLDSSIVRSLLLKTITTPVALEVGEKIFANLQVIAPFVILTGILGAMFVSPILNRFGITHAVARGLTYGVIAHGIGTAQALKENDDVGAVSSAAMGLTAAILGFFIPIVYKAFQFF